LAGVEHHRVHERECSGKGDIVLSQRVRQDGVKCRHHRRESWDRACANDTRETSRDQLHGIRKSDANVVVRRRDGRRAAAHGRCRERSVHLLERHLDARNLRPKCRRVHLVVRLQRQDRGARFVHGHIDLVDDLVNRGVRVRRLPRIQLARASDRDKGEGKETAEREHILWTDGGPTDTTDTKDLAAAY